MLQLDMHKLKEIHIKLTKDSRLYNLSCPIIGLTGGIATGKSTVSKMLCDKGLKIIDADSLVKEIYKRAEVFDFIKSTFPDCVKSESIQFNILREHFFSRPETKKIIEEMIYKYLPTQFLSKVDEILKTQNFIIYDIPLLFEKKLNSYFDLVITVYVPQKTQIERLLKRDSIDIELAKTIIKNQENIETKRKLSDMSIDNTNNLTELDNEVSNITSLLLQNVLV